MTFIGIFGFGGTLGLWLLFWINLLSGLFLDPLQLPLSIVVPISSLCVASWLGRLKTSEEN
jgi:hypothetical protein